jgi:phospholipid transport system substrate-binding protein
MHRLVTLSFSLAVAALMLLPSGSPASTRAIDEVKTTVDNVLDVLKDKAAPLQQRRDRIRQLVRGRFDFELMSQSTLGRQWNKASREEKDTFIGLYSKLLEATYVGRIEEYTDERIKYDSEKVRGDKALVETKIVTDSVEIPIDYKLVQTASGWKVYDVVIEGVSLIRNFRSSYGTIVDNEGFSGLFARMETKVQELEK